MTLGRAGSEIQLTSEGEPLAAYRVLPASGRGRAALVIHEGWGLVDHIRDVCDRLAREDFVALAPDLYGGRIARDREEAQRLTLELEIPRAAREIDGAVAALLGHASVEGAGVGAVGFGMGGQLALHAASRNPRIGAVVDFYGAHPGVTLDLAGLEAAALGIFAGRDEYVTPEAVRDLEARFESAGKRLTVVVQPDVRHAFMNDSHPDVYDAKAAEAGWDALLAHLRAELA